MRKWIDLVSENLKSDMMEGLEKIGAYTNRAGAVVTMHRNTNDPKHLMLVSDGQVVGNHVGSPEEYHAKITADGMSGALLNEEIVEEAYDPLPNMIQTAIEKSEPYVAWVRGTPGDGALTTVTKAVEEMGVVPNVINLGHNCVGQGGGVYAFKQGVNILDINPHNLSMCIGEKGVEAIRKCIQRAGSEGYYVILVTKGGDTQLGKDIESLFVHYDYTGGDAGPNIEDGGIHRIV